MLRSHTCSAAVCLAVQSNHRPVHLTPVFFALDIASSSSWSSSWPDATTKDVREETSLVEDTCE